MKYISLIRRRADFSREAFRDYYENHHAPLAMQFFPPQLYQRNHLNNPPDEHRFDCLCEFDYADDVDLLQVLQSEAGPALARDEFNFIERDSTLTAQSLPLRRHLADGRGPRQRELWLYSAETEVADVLLLSLFEQLQPQFGSAQGACLYRLKPFYCEHFPYFALLTLEGAWTPALPTLPAGVSMTRLCVSSCPSAPESGSVFP